MARTTLSLILILTISFSAKGQMPTGWKFHDEMMKDLEHPGDTIYIQNRKKLEKIRPCQITKDTVVVNSITKKGDSIYLLMTAGKFDPQKHKLKIADTMFKVKNGKKYVDDLIGYDTIDGRKAFGIDASIPSREIKNLAIRWNNNNLKIPKEAYSNLYEPNLGIIGYIAKNRKLLYIYLSGSDGAGSYSAKLVFDRKSYITKLISTCECADQYDFLDATTADCE